MAHRYRPLALQKQLDFAVDGPASFIAKTDPEKLRRIAQNLLVNALEHTSSGSVSLTWRTEQSRWIMAIQDTGPGMQDLCGSPVARELNRLDSGEKKETGFDTTLAYSGEGIGLTIVKRLCDLLDAGITMESALGEGTQFTIDFPLDYPNPPLP